MKHLLFVSVALGIFSGTTIQASGQTSVNLTRVNDAAQLNISEKFIDGIEINQGANIPDQPLYKKNRDKTRSLPKSTIKNSENAIENCTVIQFKYAQLLNVEVETIAGNSLFSFIEKWWATPYRYGGTTQSGVDCSAYSYTLLHQVYGITVSRTSRAQYKECEKIHKDDLREGDLVFFNTRRGVSHVGIYLGNRYFTHASVGDGVTISNLDDPYYRKKYIGGGRILVPTSNSE